MTSKRLHNHLNPHFLRDSRMINPQCRLMAKAGAALLPMLLWLSWVIPAAAQTVPAAAAAGLQPKLLEQSRLPSPPGEPLADIHIETMAPGQPVPAADGATLTVRAIRVEGATRIAPAELEARVNPSAEGAESQREITFGELLGLAERISAYYAEQGFLLARAYIPRQEVKDGVVVIRVQEGRITRLSARGQSRYQTDELLQWLTPVSEQDSPRTATLERALLELNDTPGLQVRSSLRRATAPGTSELVLEVTESRPYSLSVDADNFGSRFTGRNRFGITGMMGSALKLGDRVSLRAMGSSGEQNFINLAYRVPVSRYGTDLHLSYTYADHELGSTLAPLNGGGETHIASLGVSHPLHRTRQARLNIHAGVEVKSFENYLLDEKSTDDSLTNAYLGMDGFFVDDWRGRTFYDLRAQFGVTEKDVSDPLNSRALGRGDAIVGSATLTRYQSAALLDSYFVMKAMAQVSSKRVLSSDLFAAGGIGTVRGFGLSEITGDHALAVSLEYVLPVAWDIPLPGSGGRPLAVFGFIDHARVYVQDPQPGEEDTDITGAGVGLRLNVPKTGKLPAIDFTLTWGTSVFGSRESTQDPNGILYLGGQVRF